MNQAVGSRYHACPSSVTREAFLRSHDKTEETRIISSNAVQDSSTLEGLLGQHHGGKHHEYKTLTKPKALSGNSMLASLLLPQDLWLNGENSPRRRKNYRFREGTPHPPPRHGAPFIFFPS